MASITRGYPKFEVAVDKFERKMIREVKRVIAETAEMMASQMKTLSPVSTIDGGNLRRSIEVEYLNDGLTAIIRVGASYGIFIEFGTGIHAEGGDGRKDPWVYFNEKTQQWVFTRGTKSQPFFRPSYEQAAQFFKTEMNRIGV